MMRHDSNSLFLRTASPCACNLETACNLLTSASQSWLHAPCRCLNPQQIGTLLHYSMQNAISESRRVVSNYDSMCCNVQNVVTDM